MRPFDLLFVFENTSEVSFFLSFNMPTAGYEPVSAARKFALLFQRSVRYSYRQKAFNCCPNLFCELGIPAVLIVLLLLIPIGASVILTFFERLMQTTLVPPQPSCSLDLNAMPSSSKRAFSYCFDYHFERAFSLVTPPNLNRQARAVNLIFQPNTSDTIALAALARQRPVDPHCQHLQIW